jgi:hypothetical protein
MPRTRAQSGELKQYKEPEWAPLLRLVGRRVVADFMWMHEIELADGTAVLAYKHIDTRRYIHLDESCQAYVYEKSDRYRPIDPARVLRAVFAGLSGLAGVERPQVEESFAVLERCRRGEYPVAW